MKNSNKKSISFELYCNASLDDCIEYKLMTSTDDREALTRYWRNLFFGMHLKSTCLKVIQVERKGSEVISRMDCSYVALVAGLDDKPIKVTKPMKALAA